MRSIVKAERAGRALLVVRNDFLHDARVLRAARVLADLGLEPVVVAVTTPRTRTRTERVGGVEVVRVAVASPLSALRSRRHVARARSPRLDGAASDVRATGVGALLWLHRSLLTWVYNVRVLGAVLARRPTVLHCNDHNTMWIGVIARLVTGTRLIYDSHELWPDRNGRWERRGWLMLSEMLFVRVADAVVVSSPGHADVMASRYRTRRPHVVRNVPDVDPSSLDGPVRWSPGPLAVYVGGLQPHRGIEQVMEALGAVPGLRLRLLGTGDPTYVAELRALATTFGVLNRVELVGAVPSESVVAEVRGADVGLALFQPIGLSHELVLPNKLFEYVLGGVPVLAGELPVVRDFLRDWACGRTVDAEDPSAIAHALVTMTEPEVSARLRDGARRAGEASTWAAERAVLLAAYATAGVPQAAAIRV